MKKRSQSISNLSILNSYYSNVFFATFEIFIYVFSTVTIVIMMIELLSYSDKYLYYGVSIFILYMLQGFYGFLNNDLYKVHTPKVCIFLKLFFLEHVSVLYNRRRQLFQQACNQAYTSIVSSSFFQGRILSVVCIYLMSFYTLQSNKLNLRFQLSIAATALNVGLYNPKFYISDDTCSEDSIHYTIEVYTRATMYSVLFLIHKDSYNFSDSSTLIDFFLLFLIVAGGISLFQLLYNLIIKKLPIVDCMIGCCHLLINCIFLRAPSNIAVHKYDLLFMKTSSYFINPQIVVLSAMHRLGECFGFFYMYYKYLDQFPFDSYEVNTQVRISQVGSAVYAYILSFQILYVLVASVTNLRECPDDIIIKQTTNTKESNIQKIQLSNHNLYSPRDKQDSTNPKESNDNSLAPIYEHEKNGKGMKDSQRITTQIHTSGQKQYQSQKKTSVFIQYNIDFINNSPQSSTDNGSNICQDDIEENQRFQALKIFNPIINKQLNTIQVHTN